MTANNSSNPLGHSNPASRTSVYRPKYRTRMANPTYALEGTTAVREGEIIGFIDQVEALEEWRANEELRELSKGVRWRPEKMTALKVYLEQTENKNAQSLLWQACREWEAISAGKIHFYPAASPEEADIVIRWQAETVLGRDFEVGHTNRTVQSSRWIQQVQMTLIITPEIDKTLSAAQVQQRLYTTLLHELGHALGMEHSQNPKDVMHHQGWRNSRLTVNDRQRLNLLYQSPAPFSSLL